MVGVLAVKNNLIIAVLLISYLLPESPSFDFSYEVKYGDGTGVTNEGNTVYDLKFNENFLKINSSYKDYYLYMELEYSDPPVLGYSKTEFKDIFSKFYIDKQFDNTYLKFGNIYTLYGVGLGIFTFPDQNIDFDNSLEGIEFKYNLGDIDMFIVHGNSNLEQRTNPAILEPNRFSENDLSIIGIDYDFNFGYGHALYKNQETYMDNSTLLTFKIDEGNRSTLLDWDFAERVDQMIETSGLSESDFWASLNGDYINTESFVVGYGAYTNFGDFYFEGEWSNYDKLLGEQAEGYRYYFSYGNNLGDLGLSYEYKDYDMPYDILTFTAPPTVAIESTSILAARNSHSMNYGDELGHQFEVVKPFGDISFLGNISISRRHKAKNKIYTFSNTQISDYIDQSSFSGSAGEEDEYIETLLSDCNDIMQSPDNMNFEENELDKISLLDYMSFGDDEEFISFYPYRQIYGELSGYLNEDLYVKVGYDLYNEVIKHKDQEIFNYPQDQLDQAFAHFYLEAEQVIDNRWQSHFDTCSQLIAFGLDCSGFNNASDYADQEFFSQFGMSREDYLESLSFNLEDLPSSSNHYRQIIEAWTIPTQITYNLGQGNSLSSYIEYQKKRITELEKYDINSFYFSGSFTYSSFLTFTLFYEGEDKVYPSQTTSKNWSGLDISFDFQDKGQLSIFYGSQKGGRVCANGICADQPGFEDGLKVTYRTFF
mgnify:CR=1 FL=1